MTTKRQVQQLVAAQARKAREAERAAFDAQVLPLSRLGLRPRVIAAKFGVKVGAVNRAEDRLADQGLLERRTVGRQQEQQP